MPLVFGGAPIVNTFVALFTSKAEMETPGPFFYAGLVMAVLGATTVLIFAPKGHAAPATANPPAQTTPPSTTPAANPGLIAPKTDGPTTS